MKEESMKGKSIKLKACYNLFFKEEILRDERLSPVHRLTLAFITAWDNDDHCFANNVTLAYVVGCSAGTTSRIIRDLIRCGYITHNYSKMGRSNVRIVKHSLKIKSYRPK
jgi:hypothetical protein